MGPFLRAKVVSKRAAGLPRTPSGNEPPVGPALGQQGLCSASGSGCRSSTHRLDRQDLQEVGALDHLISLLRAEAVELRQQIAMVEKKAKQEAASRDERIVLLEEQAERLKDLQQALSRLAASPVAGAAVAA